MTVYSEAKEESFTAMLFARLLFETRSVLGNFYVLSAVEVV